MAGILMLVSGAVVIKVVSGKSKHEISAAIVVLVSLGDLWLYGSKYIMVSPLSSCHWPRGLTDFLKGDRGVFRICAPNISVPGANQNMNEGIPSIDGYETVNVGVFKRYVDFAQGIDSRARLTFEIRDVSPMIEALNLKYLLLPAGQPFVRKGYRQRYNDGQVAVYERDNPSPRAYVVHSARVLSGGDEILQEIEKRGATVPDEVLLEKAPDALPSVGGVGHSKALIIADLPREVVLHVETSRPGFLVLRDTYYPGWKAYVDGVERQVHRADYAFRAVRIEEGSHTVRFVYRPASFALGAGVSLAALFAVAFCLVAETSRRLHGGLR